jgi:hypothetical protein
MINAKGKFGCGYTEEEITKRFETALRGAFSTPPTPMKDLPRKRPKMKKKPRKKATATASA